MKKLRKNSKEDPEHLRVGKIGEETACVYLKRKGYRIVERNYGRKWGELDIVAEKDNILHFVEVKATAAKIVPGAGDQFRAEEHVHAQKIARLRRIVQTYLAERAPDADWRFHVLVVRIDFDSRRVRVRFLENLTLE